VTCLNVYTHHTASVSARLSDCEDIIPVSYVVWGYRSLEAFPSHDTIHLQAWLIFRFLSN